MYKVGDKVRVTHYDINWNNRVGIIYRIKHNFIYIIDDLGNKLLFDSKNIKLVKRKNLNHPHTDIFK